MRRRGPYRCRKCSQGFFQIHTLGDKPGSTIVKKCLHCGSQTAWRLHANRQDGGPARVRKIPKRQVGRKPHT